MSNSSKSKKIKVVPVGIQVAHSLRDAILSRELKPDEIINLNTIAEQLGVSNTPVREALQILANEGLIELRANKGARVIGMTKKRISDYYETRIILESAAAFKAAGKDAVRSIEDVFYQEERAVMSNDYGAYSHLNHQFHQAIWSAADNDEMYSILNSLSTITSRSVYSTPEDYIEKSHYEHSIILSALKSGDAEKARAAMSEHLQRGLNDMLTYYPEDE
ncbi:MAG: GntR family transcriptional regulator [Oscillospiraceae bacterium]|nr:GntR family transcriptional regulator [Oscillospiraceae bacterium]